MKIKNEKLRVIPTKNYITIFTIIVLTFILSLSVFVYFNAKQKDKENIPIIRGVIPEIEVKELDSYISEHDDFLLYIGVADNSNCRKLEEDLKVFIKEKNISNILYLNLTNVTDKTSFYDEFNKKYSSNIKLSNYPAFVIIKNNKIYDLVERSNRSLFIGDIQRILDEYNIVGE